MNTKYMFRVFMQRRGCRDVDIVADHMPATNAKEMCNKLQARNKLYVYWVEEPKPAVLPRHFFKPTEYEIKRRKNQKAAQKRALSSHHKGCFGTQDVDWTRAEEVLTQIAGEAISAYANRHELTQQALNYRRS